MAPACSPTIPAVLSHMGAEETTTGLIRLAYVWLSMVKEYCKSCLFCARSHSAPSRPSAPFAVTSQPQAKSQRTSKVPLEKKKTTKNSNRFVLVVVDLLTRVAEMIPLPNKSISQNCSQCSHMRDVFCRRGILGSILTDRGCQFDHQALRTIAHQLGIDKKHIWAQHASPS